MTSYRIEVKIEILDHQYVKIKKIVTQVSIEYVSLFEELKNPKINGILH